MSITQPDRSYQEKSNAGRTWGTSHLRIGDGEKCRFVLIAFWLFLRKQAMPNADANFCKGNLRPEVEGKSIRFHHFFFLLRLIDTCLGAIRAVWLLSCYRVPNALNRACIDDR
ncbi:hypothetical protein N9D23_03905 [Rubripirellula sp.]|nr:hypothetical protein [Rubripirellula sp.]